MDIVDQVNESDPLKRGEDVTAPSATELKKKKCKEGLGCSRMSHWRTAVFFLSLFICLTIVFAFSFIIPCPVRAQYLITWNRSFSEAGVHSLLYSISVLHHFKRETNNRYIIFSLSHLWLPGFWTRKQGQSGRCPFCSEKLKWHTEQLVCWRKYWTVHLNWFIKTNKRDWLLCVVFQYKSDKSPILFQTWLGRVCFCWHWTAPMGTCCGRGRWLLSSTGLNVVWAKKHQAPGTVCCPIQTASQPLTNTQVSDPIIIAVIFQWWST